MTVNNKFIGPQRLANTSSSIGIWYLDEQQQARGANNWVPGSVAPPPPSFTATGGTEATPGNGYKYHTFTTSSTFTVTGGPKNMEVLVVGGGGGAGYYQSGGGGAGGLAYNPSLAVGPGPYPIIVGSGGPGAPGGSATGNDSTALGITAKGGGRGGSRSPSNQAGSPGGSGGGAASQEPSSGYTYSATQPSQTHPTAPGTLNYGNPGGGGSANNGPVYGGGGGGGAGGSGSSGNGSTNGPGGAGRQYPQFTGPLIGLPALNPYSGFFAGGGAAGGNDPTNASGGSGGGGNAPPSGGQSGVNNLGGGGGGPSGSGGSGIVVIRYLV